MSSMYDEKGMLRPEYALSDSEKRQMIRRQNEFYYLTCDGHECSSMEEVMQYNQAYYDQMKKRSDNNNIIENDRPIKM